MHKKLLCILLTLLLLCACAGGPALPQLTDSPAPAPAPIADAPMMLLEQLPKIDGSTATIPLAQALVQYATGCDAETAEGVIQFSTTDASYYALAEGKADLLLVYEASPSVVQELDFENTLDLYPIGRDALVFLVNENNPIDSLTTAQLQDIYSGKTTNWKQLGGPHAPIVAFQRPLLSGSQTMMQKLVMGEIVMMQSPNELYIPTMEWLIKEVAAYNNDGNAIGYSVYYYAKNMYSLPGLKFLRVEGVTPTEHSIAEEDYPFINEFYAVTRKDADANTKQLVDFLLSAQGQAFIAGCGYVPMDGAALPLPAAEISDIPLWDEAYYAVLPGEHMSCLVWDCYGRQIGSFSRFGLGEYIGSGLYTAEELAETALFIDGRQLDLASPTNDQVTTRYANGFARYDWKTGVLSVYDKQCKLRYTVQGELAPRDPYDDEGPAAFALGAYDLLYFSPWSTGELIRPQLRTRDGELVSYVALEDEDALIVGGFAGQYILGLTMVEVEMEDRTRSTTVYSIYDLDGRALVRGITPIAPPDFTPGGIDNSSLPDMWENRRLISDSYFADAKIWDGDFAVIAEGEAEDRWDWPYEKIGDFVRGFTYDMDSVPSDGTVRESAWGAFVQGFADGQLYAMRGGKVYRFTVDAERADLMDFNDNFALISTWNPIESNWEYEVRFLQSGHSIKPELKPFRYPAMLSEQHVTIFEYSDAYHVIFDTSGAVSGNIRPDCWNIHALPCDLFLVIRGSYIGIIDVSGNWLVRTLRPLLAEDIGRWGIG
ncbi:MAG: substrate-binding domain-containing protein [Clostridiales bacterium]|nr:substrate-binding domain-containing protein [Clostridiales bacterium]